MSEVALYVGVMILVLAIIKMYDEHLAKKDAAEYGHRAKDCSEGYEDTYGDGEYHHGCKA